MQENFKRYKITSMFRLGACHAHLLVHRCPQRSLQFDHFSREHENRRSATSTRRGARGRL